jgi:hypothetical protein
MEPTMTRLWILAVAVLAACGSPQAPAPALTSRDSAGVSLVETRTPVWDNAAPWTVDTTPTFTVGEAEGEEPYLFSYITGAIRRDDGTIVVADGATRELRVFDSTGRFILAKGRRGPGPGEFGAIHRIARCGASELWVDAGSRISVWNTQLEYLREFPVTDNIMWPLVCFGGTGLLVKRDIGIGVDPPVNTMYFDSLNLMVVDSVGASRHDLMPIPLWEYINVPSKRIGFHPFGRSTVLAGDGSNLVLGFAERLEIETYTREGQLLRVARGPNEDLSLTAAIRDEYRSAPLAGQAKVLREALEAAGNPMPRTIPAYTELKVDAEGNVWVKRFDSPGGSTNRWGVFGRGGEFLGHVQFPQGLEVFEIGPDYVLGQSRDTLSVGRVQLHILRK